MGCSFHSRFTAARARPWNRVEMLFGNPLYFCLRLALYTKPDQRVSRNRCVPKTTPLMQVGRVRWDVGWCRPPPPAQSQWQPRASPALTCWNTPRVPLDSPRGFGKWEPQPGPVLSLVCRLSWQKAIRLFCRMEGGMGRCHKEWGDRRCRQEIVGTALYIQLA